MEWPAKARPRQRVARGGGWSGPGCWVGGEGGARMARFPSPPPRPQQGTQTGMDPGTSGTGRWPPWASCCSLSRNTQL